LGCVCHVTYSSCADMYPTLGVHAVLAAVCLQSILHRDPTRQRRRWLMMGLVIILFAMGTINFAGNNAISVDMFVDNRSFPGGPSAYLAAYYSSPVNVMGNAAYCVANFVSDGIMVSSSCLSCCRTHPHNLTDVSHLRCLEWQLFHYGSTCAALHGLHRYTNPVLFSNQR
jgi:hypothetical protein